MKKKLYVSMLVYVLLIPVLGLMISSENQPISLAGWYLFSVNIFLVLITLATLVRIYKDENS
jgi:hypothetical protein